MGGIQVNLGRLTPIDLRTVWKHEERHFSRWLEKDIGPLAEVLGLEGDLEIVNTEEPIGRYRADIVCSSQAGKVLVENQLEKTNHSHLGQILTYAAGIEASAVVWVAASFTEEHRAALDWLNSITDGIDFFGLEIELWRIGDSDPAPKFNIVSKPNDWSRSVAAQAREVSPLGQMQLEYWTRFSDVLLASDGPARGSKPAARHWFGIPIGRGGFSLSGVADTRGGRIRAEMYIQIGNAIGFFEALREDRADIESDLGFALDWQPLHGKKACRIAITEDLDPKDESTWSEQHRWLADHLNRMHEVLAPRVRVLEPIPENSDDSEDG